MAVWLETGVARVLLSTFIAKLEGLLPTFGFSARLTGGGPGFCETSRLCSPDLLGGGGEGGFDGGSEWDLPGSRRGVCGLLGILKCLGEEAPEVEDNGAPADKYGVVFDTVRFNTLFLGGDCGGWIVTVGGTTDKGRVRRFRAGDGDGDMLPDPFAEGGRKPPLYIIAFSLPLPFCPSPTMLSPRLIIALAGSTLLIALITGLGEIGLGGAVVLLFGFEFAICSKCERREDTGFCDTGQYLARYVQ